MSVLGSNNRAVDVWFDKDNIWVRLEDGRQVSAPLAFYPRLFHASKKKRNKFQLIGRGIGIHWPDIDEDLSVEGIVLGRKDQARFSRAA